MNRRTRWITIGTLTLAFAGGGAGVAMASGGGDDGADKPITGPALARAGAAALAYTHGGKVTGTEVGDEESYYEVEVTRPGGRQTDVQLDRDFKVVGSKTDGGDRSGKDG
ncbi:PepSY domain-containing protein [Actinomadura alba]|uniref:PepSY domain-containing protein n=1 Tax=Actinomadura alba TaxID=406431 RepID=A0ABR7LW94_9ACTN|nr:PepSY domain-containing protein [Actinomadura alba]MBC6468854.1 PepSY domain-containing protein [Actinomadura alba]